MYTMKDLTRRQKEILTFIQDYEWRNGYWPSIREIQERFDFKSTNAVMGHLRALEKKSIIERIPGQARTFRIHRQDHATEVSEIPADDLITGVVIKEITGFDREILYHAQIENEILFQFYYNF